MQTWCCKELWFLIFEHIFYASKFYRSTQNIKYYLAVFCLFIFLLFYRVEKFNSSFVAERFLDFHLTKAHKSAMSPLHPWWVQLYITVVLCVWLMYGHLYAIMNVRESIAKSHSGWLESWMNIFIFVFHWKLLVIPLYMSYICFFIF